LDKSRHSNKLHCYAVVTHAHNE